MATRGPQFQCSAKQGEIQLLAGTLGELINALRRVPFKAGCPLMQAPRFYFFLQSFFSMKTQPDVQPARRILSAAARLPVPFIALAVIAFLTASLIHAQSNYSWSIFAGYPGGAGFTDGSRGEARFFAPTGMAVDSSGVVHVLDTAKDTLDPGTTNRYQTAIRRVSANGSLVTTMCNAVTVNPGVPAWVPCTSIALRSDGSAYLNGGSEYQKVSSSGSVSQWRLGQAGIRDGVVCDASGNIYYSDRANHVIRKLTSGGVDTVYAGVPGVAGQSDNAVATSALFKQPKQLAIDADGNIFVSDNLSYSLRRIASTGQVTTLYSETPIPGTPIGPIYSITWGPVTGMSGGAVYMVRGFLESYGTTSSVQRVDAVTPTASPTVIVSESTNLTWGPRLVATDAAGRLYLMSSSPFNWTSNSVPGFSGDGSRTNPVASQGGGSVNSVSYRLQRFNVPASPTASYSIDLAGFGTVGGSTESISVFCGPTDLSMDTVSGDLYVVDSYSSPGAVKKVNAAGITTIFTSGSGVNSVAYTLSGTNKDVYVAAGDSVYRVRTDTSGVVQVRSLTTPSYQTAYHGVALNGTTVFAGMGNSIYKFTLVDDANGVWSMPVLFYDGLNASPSTSAWSVSDVSVDSSTGYLYAALEGYGILKKSVTSTSATTAERVLIRNGLLHPAIDGASDGGAEGGPTSLLAVNDTVYFTDASSHAVRKLSPATSTGTVSTLASVAGTQRIGQSQGVGAEASFSNPMGIAGRVVSGEMQLFVADLYNHTISGGMAPTVISNIAQTQIIGTSATTAQVTVSATITPPTGYTVTSVSVEYGPSTVYGSVASATLTGTNVYSATLLNLTRGSEYYYRFKVVYSSGLIYNSPPNVLTDSELFGLSLPVNVAALLGSSATFSVGSASPSATYQWKQGATVIGGATSSSYSIPSVATTNAAVYTVTITQPSVGPQVTATAKLVVVKPNVNTQVAAAGNIQLVTTLTVPSGVAAANLSYVWRYNGTPVPAGGRVTITNTASAPFTSTFKITGAQVSDSGSYDCVVTYTDTSVSPASVVSSPPAVSNVDVVPGKPVFDTPLPLDPITVADQVNLALSATNLPTSWAKTSGTLPPGITFSAAGVLSGVPTTAGTYTFAVTATNVMGANPAVSIVWAVNPLPSTVTGRFVGLMDLNGPINSGIGGLVDINIASTGNTGTGTVLIGSETAPVAASAGTLIPDGFGGYGLDVNLSLPVNATVNPRPAVRSTLKLHLDFFSWGPPTGYVTDSRLYYMDQTSGISTGGGDIHNLVALADGSFYVLDTTYNQVIKLDPSGVPSVYAGQGGEFLAPQGLTMDNNGNLYVSDAGDGTVKKVTPAGVVSTVHTGLNQPGGLVWVTAGANINKLFIVETGMNRIVRSTGAGATSVFAGSTTGVSGQTGDGQNSTTVFTNNGVNARFYTPTSIATDSAGNLYVTDSDNQVIRKIFASYNTGGNFCAVKVHAGAYLTSEMRDGLPTVARFSSPYSVSVDASGIIWILDYNGLRSIDTSGQVVTRTDEGGSTHFGTCIYACTTGPQAGSLLIGGGGGANYLVPSFSGAGVQAAVALFPVRLTTTAPAVQRVNTLLEPASAEISAGGGRGYVQMVSASGGSAGAGFYATWTVTGRVVDGSTFTCAYPAVTGPITGMDGSGADNGLGAAPIFDVPVEVKGWQQSIRGWASPWGLGDYGSQTGLQSAYTSCEWVRTPAPYSAAPTSEFWAGLNSAVMSGWGIEFKLAGSGGVPGMLGGTAGSGWTFGTTSGVLSQALSCSASITANPFTVLSPNPQTLTAGIGYSYTVGLFTGTFKTAPTGGQTATYYGIVIPYNWAWGFYLVTDPVTGMKYAEGGVAVQPF